MSEQSTSAEVSQPGRRVLVAVVTGEAGDRVRAWREQHDSEQARRLPPHATLCYWAPVVEPEVLERQVRHAFAEPVTVRLGSVHEFDNEDRTFYVEVLDTAGLDAARERLYDGAHLELPGRREWTWHVTCVRYGVRRDLDELRRLAAELALDLPWRIDTVAYLELGEGRYDAIAEWRV